LATDGGFGPNGTFYVLPKVSLSGLEQLFRHRVLKMMLRAGLITPQRVKLLLSWKHSGFNVDGSVRVRAGAEKLPSAGVLFIGDSMTMGCGVNDGEEHPYLDERVRSCLRRYDAQRAVTQGRGTRG